MDTSNWVGSQEYRQTFPKKCQDSSSAATPGPSFSGRSVSAEETSKTMGSIAAKKYRERKKEILELLRIEHKQRFGRPFKMTKIEPSDQQILSTITARKGWGETKELFKDSDKAGDEMLTFIKGRSKLKGTKHTSQTPPLLKGKLKKEDQATIKNLKTFASLVGEQVRKTTNNANYQKELKELNAALSLDPIKRVDIKDMDQKIIKEEITKSDSWGEIKALLGTCQEADLNRISDFIIMKGGNQDELKRHIHPLFSKGISNENKELAVFLIKKLRYEIGNKIQKEHINNVIQSSKAVTPSSGPTETPAQDITTLEFAEPSQMYLEVCASEPMAIGVGTRDQITLDAADTLLQLAGSNKDKQT